MAGLRDILDVLYQFLPQEAVLGLLAVLLSVCPSAVIFHFASSGALGPDALQRLLIYGNLWLIIVTTLLSVVPLMMGRKALMNRDF